MSDESVSKTKSLNVSAPTRPREITPENVHLADFDNLKIKLLCVVKNTKKFSGVASYLTRRGWEVEVTDQVRDALKMVATTDPDYIMVSMNAGNRNITQMPQIVLRTFKIETIIFGESTDTKTIQMLQTTVSSHKIMGVVSGPMLQRRLKQIIKQTHRVDNQDESNDSDSEDKRQSSTITVKEQKLDRQSSTTVLGGADDNKENSNYESGPQNQIDHKGPKVEKDRPGMIIFKKDQSPSNSKEGAAYIPTPDSQEHQTDVGHPDNVEDLNSILNEVLGEQKAKISESPRKEKNLTAQQDARKPHKDLNQARSTVDDSQAIVEEKANSKEKNWAEKAKEEKESLAAALNDLKKDISSGNLDNGQTTEIGKSGDVVDTSRATSSSDYLGRSGKAGGKLITPIERQSKLEMLVIKTLDDLNHDKSTVAPQIGLITSIVVVPVHQEQMTGYLLFVSENTSEPLDLYVERFKSQIQKRANEGQHHIRTAEHFTINIEQYDFFDNCEDGILFNLTGYADGGEVAIKFIENEKAWPEIVPQERNEKAGVKIESVVEEKNLTFDVFIYLKKNEKFYKIVNDGSALSSDRKERLAADNTPTYINKDDEPIFRTFSARHNVAELLQKNLLLQKMKAKTAA